MTGSNYYSDMALDDVSFSQSEPPITTFTYPDISAWNVSAVTNMRGMFHATSFDQDISAWNVSASTDMSGMFYRATSFNQDISAWNVTAVRDMNAMFYRASSFEKIICSDAWRASKSKASQHNMFSGTNGAGICE